MNYLQDPTNVAARRSSSAERSKWFGEDIDANDLRSPDEITWRRDVASRTENLGLSVGVLVLEGETFNQGET